MHEYPLRRNNARNGTVYTCDILRKTRTMTSHEAAFKENGRLVIRFFSSFFSSFFLFIFDRGIIASSVTICSIAFHIDRVPYTVITYTDESRFLSYRDGNYLTRQGMTLQNFFAWLIIFFPSFHISTIHRVWSSNIHFINAFLPKTLHLPSVYISHVYINILILIIVFLWSLDLRSR